MRAVLDPTLQVFVEVQLSNSFLLSHLPERNANMELESFSSITPVELACQSDVKPHELTD